MARPAVTDRDAWDDPLVWEGIGSLLDDYAGVVSGDVVVIAYTSDSREAAARVSVALEGRAVEVRRVWMAPLHDEGFLERFQNAMPSPGDVAGRLVVFTFERDTKSHDSLIEQAISPFDEGRCAVVRVISVCPELFAGALRAAPEQLSARNAQLLDRLRAARSLVVTTPGGTKLAVALDNRRYRWLNNQGSLRPGQPLFLPPGEVATFPASIDGVLVADFAYNVNMVTERDVRLQAHPVTIEVKGGRAVDHACDDREVERFVGDCLQRQPEARIVGELGFGTNFRVDSAVALNSHINERRPGVHLGFGEHNQSVEVVDYRCVIHLDLIARGGSILVDGDPEPIDLDVRAPSFEGGSSGRVISRG